MINRSYYTWCWSIDDSLLSATDDALAGDPNPEHEIVNNVLYKKTYSSS